MNQREMFKCKRCGQCCRNVGKTIQGIILAKENGVCRYLDEDNNLCTIYDNRPIFCNVDAYYNEYFKNSMSVDDFYNENYKICKIISKRIK